MEARVSHLEKEVTRLNKDLGDSNCEIFTLRHRLAQLERRIPISTDELQPWPLYARTMGTPKQKPTQQFRHSEPINSKITLWQGDITRLKIEAIVTTRSGNDKLVNAFDLNSIIHETAGPELNQHDFSRSPTVTPAYKLPSTYVIHLQSPKPNDADSVADCYRKSLDLVASDARAIKTIAFPCIGTGSLGQAWRWMCAETALDTVRQWMENNHSKVDKIVLCVFGDRDRIVYEQLMQEYFPIE